MSYIDVTITPESRARLLEELRTKLGPDEERDLSEATAKLRAAGYLVLSPSDTSPVAELVRAAVAVAQGLPLHPGDVRMKQIVNAAIDAEGDPAVRAWVERGRKT